MEGITIRRAARKDGYTIGRLYVNGSYVCNTLEPRDRTFLGESFILGTSAIPAGTYTLATDVWSPRFNGIRPRITDFRLSKNILIHEGNTPKDTEGCILVGDNLVRGRVLNSRKHLARLQELLSGNATWKLVIC